MVQIDTVGGYVPLYRISRQRIAEQHGGSASGETAVPARDETLVTMASEAAGTALDRSPGDVGAVFAASVTDPFAEHGVAAQVAYRHELDGDCRTGDFRATPRAASDALVAGTHFVEATGDRALVVAADSMPVERGHDDEPYSGAAAGAAILAPGDGDDEGEEETDAAADVHGIGQRTTGFVERHRTHGDPAESGDKRYEGEYGFGEATPDAVTEALGSAPAMPSEAVINVPDARLAASAVEEFPGDVRPVSTFDRVGYAGAASFLLDLAYLIEEADPDTTAVGVSYGAGGVDAVVFTTHGVDPGETMTVSEHLDASETVTYAEHLRFRERPDYPGVQE